MSEANPDLIARELAELGEEPLSGEELALLTASEDAVASDDDARHDDVATVAQLHALAEPIGFDDLSELERQRGWRTLEGRLAGPAPGPSTQRTQPAKGGGQARWLFAAVGLAAAAAIVLLVLRPGSAGPSADEVAKTGAQVRGMLEVLDDGRSDSERADDLAADYARRLAASDPAGPAASPEGGGG